MQKNVAAIILIAILIACFTVPGFGIKVMFVITIMLLGFVMYSRYIKKMDIKNDEERKERMKSLGLDEND